MRRSQTIAIEHINIHETVSFKMAVLEDNGEEKIELVLVTNPDVIYKSSDYTKVLHPPRNIALQLNLEQIIYFVTCLIDSISLVLEDDSLSFEEAKNFTTTNGLTISFRKPVSENSRYKLIVDIFNESTSFQVISFNISKTRIILLLLMFKDTFEKYKNDFIFAKVKSDNFVFPIVKSKDKLGLKGIWLRNTEKELLRYIVNSLIFDYKFGDISRHFRSIHRQIMVFENPRNSNLSFSIKQIDNELNHMFFVMNSEITAVLYLFLSEKINFEGDYIDEY